MFASADIDCLPLNPRLCSDLLGYLLERFITILSEVIYDNILCAVHLADFPVCDVAHAVIHTAHYHCHMLPGWRRKRKYRVLLIVNLFQHEKVPQQAVDTIELDVIHPLKGRFLYRAVCLAQPVTLPLEVAVVIDIKSDMLVMCERERQDVVALDLLHLSGTVGW